MANRGPIQMIFIETLVVDIVISAGHDYWVKKGELTMQHGAQTVKRTEFIAGRGIRGDAVGWTVWSQRELISS